MIPLEEAQARVLDACSPLRPTAVPLGEALGLVTSVPLVAEEALPPFANTAMDGFAVRAADTPGTLTVVGTLAAGSSPDVKVGEGEAVRIMTGAPIPPGADAVVMVERTSAAEDGATVVVHHAATPGEHVREAGDDIAAGQEVFPAFTELHAAHLGVLAGLGFRRVPVFSRARVGVLSTGSELVDEPRPLRPGEIRDANRSTLLALVRESGCIPVDLGIVRDEPDDLRAAFRRGVEQCDAVVTSGGVSVGDFDYVKVVLDELSGGTVQWMQVAIKPAKPFAFGVVDGTPVFGLPGNPVSSLVGFELFARPALRRITGHRILERPHVRAVADDGLPRRPDGKLHLVRVAAAFGDDGRVHVRSAGAQGSHQLWATAAADAIAYVPDGDGIPAGGLARTMLLRQP
ncbi:MAG TPA: gephyrin-like molybdotransferase Glp [Acidimicrobiales bacterium]|nr:gephyrin-like molybdotransferase Glp [Acidimicrobiales bacterium]